ncbi:MAG: carbon-phosphorus lyase complex subunit PhnI [Deltaproteobacteria bacterium]|jgi:alpha-D-ribose 1-methylphosphonate 5-triphosphate synthase subunit PhnI|nr:carbon-phosphorus lyase complex subunit PhnI [Deltaproteobacteria bacterium]
MYVAVKGGAKAIDAAHRLLAKKRRGPKGIPGLSLSQIASQLALSVARVMAEGSLYAPRLAALAVKQAMGDLVEAAFLLRAARGAYPSFGRSLPLDTSEMRLSRRISATWKDLPGGQKLGPTFDYTHRLLEHSLADDGEGRIPAPGPAALSVPGAGFAPDSDTPARPDSPLGRAGKSQGMPRAASILLSEGILEQGEEGGGEPGDITRETQGFPMGRDMRLQTLGRADEGFLLSLAYSTQRGFGSTHPFVNELRIGKAEVSFVPAELGFPVVVGEIELTECETVNQFMGGPGGPMFTRGYGLVFGNNERKALAMALVERALRAEELGEPLKGPAQDQEFVLAHGDNVEASGFVGHLKLPHYVDFQSELGLLRDIRKNRSNTKREGEEERLSFRPLEGAGGTGPPAGKTRGGPSPAERDGGDLP